MGLIKNYLFMSRKCPYSLELLKKIKSEHPNLLNNGTLLFINVDNKKQTIPEFIKKVPSLFYSENEKRILLVGRRQIDNWLNNRNNQI